MRTYIVRYQERFTWELDVQLERKASMEFRPFILGAYNQHTIYNVFSPIVASEPNNCMLINIGA